jgi:hypothetical protein
VENPVTAALPALAWTLSAVFITATITRNAWALAFPRHRMPIWVDVTCPAVGGFAAIMYGVAGMWPYTLFWIFTVVMVTYCQRSWPPCGRR